MTGMFGQVLPRQEVPDPAAAAVLMQLRDCLCNELSRSTFGPACRCYVTWGAQLPIQDGCSCSCGLHDEHNGDAWVKLDSLEPDLAGTPSGNELVGWCAPGWTATITLGAYRCVPVPEEGDEPLAAEAMTDTSLALLSDMAAMWRVLSCCPGILENGLRVIGWTPIDASGGCAGGSLTIQLPLAGTSCPP